MYSRTVSLTSSQGTAMAGTIDLPDTPPLAYAIFAHCFTGSRFTPAASRIAKKLTDFGIATLRFDFPGLGQSEGDFAETSFSSNVEDLRCAYEFMEANYAAPQLMIGHSLGGAAVLRAAGQLKGLKAVATVGAPFDPAHSVLHYADRIKEVDEHGAVTVILGGREIVISRPFLEDLAETNVEAYLPRLRRPLLIVHSPVDQTVGVDNAQKIFQLTRYPKSLVSLDKADHLLTRQGAAARAGEIIGTWVKPYLVPVNQETSPEPGTVVSTPAGGSRQADTVTLATGRLTTDLPRERGGKSAGHSPDDLVLAALSADAAEAIRTAARAQRITLDDVSVTLTRTAPRQARRTIALSPEPSATERATLVAAADGTDLRAVLAGLDIQDA
ncbi:alpha/beta hydrolase family protein [Corynebacterium uberis]|uniref:alpha/beta hydrolase family protein n=1 Tax=Corynebacterium TaxID=1716 RepID=UPI001D09F032|nr:alpha/beta fold hydrolase [Corynebacterium uberis]MCZ9308703.1 lysophospholipase [Corynebacterium sp. c6VSa_13]UDL74341.1 alpha/beta hydrolase [Corynebacterium uberis]UDL76826.1 alpha/beta hydrolase [Corynebacterium uberis]UDL79039.1 alpha/beta hydrolase [Corynebacterium uberis]UDL79277.1 alpha/beta hydrolase [Corynebacterium uberis]